MNNESQDYQAQFIRSRIKNGKANKATFAMGFSVLHGYRFELI